MAVRASLSKQIESLVADLSAASAVTRDAAVARLTVIGARAVERLIALASANGETTPARVAAWRALEAIGDRRALKPALELLGDSAADALLGVAATGVAGAFIRGARGATVVDRLTAIVLDRARAEPVRVAALRALRELDASTIAPVIASLAGDPSARLQKAVRAPDPLDLTSIVMRAAEQELPDDPAMLRRALGRCGGAVPLPLLLRIIERVREREGAERGAKRDEWRQARAAAHVALANRGSRLAVYDLRESLASATATLPVEFLTALSVVGDVSCLEPIAAAHARTKDAWLRQHLTDAFYAIVTREKLTGRSAVIKKVAKKWTAMAGRTGGPGKAGG